MRNWVFLLCLLPNLVWSQSIKPLNDGIYAYESGNYPESIRTLAALIEAEGSLPGSQLPKAHFYLAQAYWEVYHSDLYKADYPEALLRAYNHLVAAQRLDRSGRYSEMSRPAINLLLPTLYMAGTEAYNDEKYELASRYFDRVHQLQPNRYDALLARGYSQWQMGDSTNAMKSWGRAIDLSPVKTEAGPEDESLVRAYALMIHARSSWGQLSLAREQLEEAYRRFPAHPLLREAELDIYLTHAPQLQNGNKHFLDEMKLRPKDQNLQLAYARYLYYQGDTLNSLRYFERVHRLDESHPTPNRFLASYYVSEARRLIDGKPFVRGNKKREEVDEQIIQYLLTAFPHLVKLHEVEPDNREWLEQMVAIAEYVQLPEAKELRKELRKMR